MSLLKSKPDPENLPAVRYMVKDQEVDLSDLNRMFRKLMESVGRKQQKKFGHLVHPETGERPDILVVLPDPGKPAIQCRLKTDSQVLREWLKSKGIVIDEIVASDAKTA